MLLFPINEVTPSPHWFLVMILIPSVLDVMHGKLQPYAVVLDSIGDNRDEEVESIRDYLLQELKTKNANNGEMYKAIQEMTTEYPKIPKQSDSSSCGLFVIYYVKMILLGFERCSLSSIFSDTTSWFDPKSVKTMRFALTKRIIETAGLQGREIPMPPFQLFPTEEMG